MERLLISPAGAVHLAASLCVNQAFSYGDQVYGLQFHLKVDEAMILRWLKMSEIGTRSPELHSGVNPDHIHGAKARHIRRLYELSDQTFCGFIALFDLEKFAVELSAPGDSADYSAASLCTSS